MSDAERYSIAQYSIHKAYAALQDAVKMQEKFIAKHPTEDLSSVHQLTLLRTAARLVESIVAPVIYIDRGDNE